jgi:hypothetical protein
MAGTEGTWIEGGTGEQDVGEQTGLKSKAICTLYLAIQATTGAVCHYGGYTSISQYGTAGRNIVLVALTHIRIGTDD